jgi:hypothetical protein
MIQVRVQACIRIRVSSIFGVRGGYHFYRAVGAAMTRVLPGRPQFKPDFL